MLTCAAPTKQLRRASYPGVICWQAGIYGSPVELHPVHERVMGTNRARASLERGPQGSPVEDNRRVVEGIIYRYRTRVPRGDLPEPFGPWQSVWKRHRRDAGDGTWDRVLAQIRAAGVSRS